MPLILFLKSALYGGGANSSRTACARARHRSTREIRAERCRTASARRRLRIWQQKLNERREAPPALKLGMGPD